MKSLKDLANSVQNLFSGAGNAINNNIVHPLARLQNFQQSNRGLVAPTLQPRTMTPTGLAGTAIANFGLQAGTSLFNTPYRIGSDIGNIIGGSISGQGLPAYSNLKSPEARLLYNFRGQSATPQQVIGNVGGMGLDYLNVATPKFLDNMVKAPTVGAGVKGYMNTLKSTIPAGIKAGGAYGLVQGLDQGRQAKSIPEQFKMAGVNAVTGAAFGGLLSGGLGTVGYLNNVVQKVLGKGLKDIPSEEAPVAAGYVRYILKNGKLKGSRPKPQMTYDEYRASIGMKYPTGQGNRVAESSMNIPRGFKPSKDWQEIPEGMAVPPGGKYKMNMTTGKTEARWDNPPNISIPISSNGSMPQVPRGFTTSVQEAPKIIKGVKANVTGTYTPKTNQQLMGEAEALLQSGAQIDLSKVQNADQKVAATIKQAISAQNTNPELAANLFNNLSEQGTQLGRGVQAYSLLQKMTPEAISLSAAGKIKQYNATAIRKIPELSGDQVSIIGDKVSQIRALPDGREKNIAINELNNTINNFIPSSIADKAITVWKAGLLTSLRTHERNLLGNTIMGASEIAKDPIAAIADRTMSLGTGQRTMTATVQGMISGAKKGTQAAKDILVLGYDPQESISKFDVNKVIWGNNPVEQFLRRATDAVYRPLGAEDKIFWHSAYARSLYDQAGAAAINAGRQGDKAFIDNLVTHPTEDMGALALNDANYATFHDKSKLSGVANAIKRAATEKGGVSGEVGKVVTNVLAPFTGVPSSIVGKTIAYSPLGLIKGSVTAGRVLAGQVPELQRQAAQEIGRGVIGTGLFGLGAYLMSKGLMTGQPKDAKEADLWAAQGKQANSVLVDGKWRSINSIGPQNLVILAGAKAQEEAQKPGGSVGEYAAGLGKDQLSQTFLAGVQGPLNALTDPARYGQSYVGNQSASIVPNIVKDTAKSQDPYQRQNNTVQDYLTNSIPGLRNQNLVKRDVLGNPMKQEPTGAGAFLDLFNSKTPTQNPIASELARLDSTGNNATPSKMNASQTIYGQKVKLTPQQLDKAVASFSPDMQQQMISMIQSPTYQQLDDTQKAKVLSDISSGAKNNDYLLNGILNGTPQTTNTQGGIPIVNSQGIQTSSVSSTNKLNKYQLQAAKDAFSNGTDNFQDLGSIVLRKDATGNVTAMTKEAFNIALDEATLTQAKAAKDTQTYQDTGAKLIDLYQSQLQDPNVDPLDKIQISNKMNALTKALGKGLGTKPKKIGRIKLVSTKPPKSLKIKLSKPKKFKIAKNSMKITASKQPKQAKFKVAKTKMKFSSRPTL